MGFQRTTNTDVHQHVRALLDKIGLSYYEEYPFLPEGASFHYFLDFYLPEIKLDVEADGAIWHSRPRDRRRDDTLLDDGVLTFRCTIKTTLEELEAAVKARAEVMY